jgi:hypothetical protein
MSDDEAYFERRAEEELEHATRALDPKVVRFHYLLTELFLERLYGTSGSRLPPEAGRHPSNISPPRPSDGRRA